MLIKIDPEFEALIPPLRPEEYQRLKLNLLQDGCRDDLKQWGDILLDGHNRYRICKEFGLNFAVSQIVLADREAALLWIEEHQLGRRNLSDDQRAIVAGRVAARRAARSAKEASAENGKAPKKKGSRDNDALPQLPRKPRTTEVVAKENNLPVRKVRAAQELEKTEAGKKLAAKVLSGEMTLPAAKKQAKPERAKTEASMDKQRKQVITTAHSMRTGYIDLNRIRYTTASGFDEEAKLKIREVCDTVSEDVRQLLASVSGPPPPREMQDADIPVTSERLK